MKKQSEYSNRYNKENTKQYLFRFNKKTDEDIIRYLDACENKLSLIKKLLRNEINRWHIG